MSYTFVDRGYSKTMVLLPGWGTYGALFTDFKAHFNYIVIEALSRSTCSEIEIAIDELKLSKVSLFGFSMGGFLAAEFANKNPMLVEDVVLLGIRKQYTPQDIAMVRGFLNRGKEAYMAKFYKACFSELDAYDKAKPLFLDKFQAKFDLNYLQAMLDYLGELHLTPELLKPIERLRFIHGKKDSIAPLSEVRALRQFLPQAKLTVLDEGHLPLSLFQGFSSLIL